MIDRVLTLLLILLVVSCSDFVAADTVRAPSEPNWISARFPTPPSSVTVDVLEIGGSQIGNNVTATRQQLDAANTDVWALNLATVGGYTADCTPRTYLVRFEPNTAACSSTPSACVEVTVDVGGIGCRTHAGVQVSYTTTDQVAIGQGITSDVLKYFAKRGQNTIKWRRLDVAADAVFSSPEHTLWEVFVYKTTLGVPHLSCTVPTTSDPAVSLPSSASCTGN